MNRFLYKRGVRGGPVGDPISFWIPKNKQKRFDQALDDHWLKLSAQRHNVLVDARSLYHAWNNVKTDITT